MRSGVLSPNPGERNTTLISPSGRDESEAVRVEEGKGRTMPRSWRREGGKIPLTGGHSYEYEVITVVEVVPCQRLRVQVPDRESRRPGRD